MFLTMNRKKHKTKVVRYYLGYYNVLNDFFMRKFLGYLLGLKVGRKIFIFALFLDRLKKIELYKNWSELESWCLRGP